MEISTKFTGVSHFGKSTDEDTLFLNMIKHRKHAPDGPIECSVKEMSAIEKDSSKQPCALVMARGKKAGSHHGGGEHFNEAHGALHSWNEEQDEHKGQIV